MVSSPAHVRYVIVSPVKDEARHVELTLQSVVRQTLTPALWVIVDDGSRDGTPEVVERYAAVHPFIKLLRTGTQGARQAGSAVIRAFNRGCGLLAGYDYDFIVKLDCDLSFAPNYFERLIERFLHNPALGIASGIYLEQDLQGRWTPVAMPPYHAFGASKVVRRLCFEQIGGFPTAAGWDTVDEIRALTRGWETGHFADLEARHHKREGSGVGPWRTAHMHGEIFYRTGGDPLFFVVKILHRLTRQPYVVGGLALTLGYLRALLARTPRLVTRSEADCYRQLLRSRLFGRTQNGLAVNSPHPGH